jgi:hypothetical protein
MLMHVAHYITIHHLQDNDPGYDRQGRREGGGGPGQFFFRGPYLKNFSGKIFFGEQPPAPQFRYLAQKNRYLILCAEIFNTQRRMGPNKKISGPPSTSGQFAPPPCPPSRRP